MTKTFVLRTDATLSCEGSTLQFGNDNEVVVPLAIYEGLYNYNGVSERKRLAARFLEYCSQFNAKELASKTGVVQENGSHLFILDNSKEFSKEIQTASNLSTVDKRVLQLCLDLKKQGKEVHLISQNPVIRHKAELLDIVAEPLKNNLFPPLKEQYRGIMDVPVSSDVISKFKASGKHGIPIETIYNYTDFQWIENCFIQFIGSSGSIVIGRYTNGMIVPLQYYRTLPNGIKAENLEQKMLFECLLAPPSVAPLVIVKGGAGTGKTFCSLAAGLENVAKYGTGNLYHEILVASPTIGMDDDIGHLPGDIVDKVGPYLSGIQDNLKNLFRLANPEDDNLAIEDKCNEVFARKFIEVQAIRFLRGRSIHSTYFIIDEAQNIPVDIILDIITRAGINCKIILMGDPSQINRPNLTDSYNGLVFGSESMKGSAYCWQVSLSPDKNLRSPLSQEALNRIKR